MSAPFSRKKLASQLTAGDIAYLLAWQAHLIAEAIACEKDLDRSPFNEAREVEALFPPPKPKHRWEYARAPYDASCPHLSVLARCTICRCTVATIDREALAAECRAQDEKGCSGVREAVGAP